MTAKILQSVQHQNLKSCKLSCDYPCLNIYCTPDIKIYLKNDLWLLQMCVLWKIVEYVQINHTFPPTAE